VKSDQQPPFVGGRKIQIMKLCSKATEVRGINQLSNPSRHSYANQICFMSYFFSFPFFVLLILLYRRWDSQCQKLIFIV